MRTRIGVSPQASACKARCAASCSRQRIGRGGECDTERIADDLKDVAPVRLDGFAQDGVMALARRFPLGGMRLREFGAAFDVGEEEGDGASGRRGHDRSHGLCKLKRLSYCAWMPAMICIGVCKSQLRQIRGDSTREDEPLGDQERWYIVIT